MRDRGWSALPRVEKDRRATRAGPVRKAAALSAVRIAISASSAAVGSGFTPQSAKTSSPASPISGRGVTISMNDETFFTPVRTPIPRIAARSVSAVVERAPATIPSNCPEATPEAAHSSGSARWARPSSWVTPRRAARSRHSPAGIQRPSAAMPSAVARAAASTVRGSVPSGRTMCRGDARAAEWIRARTSMEAAR